MLLNLTPLKKYPDFRLLFIGQVVSFLGSMVSYVAVPYQVYQLTHDNYIVGLMGVVQLLPLVGFGILGGTYADRLDRKKLLIVSEVLMSLLVLGLFLNSLLPNPSVIAIFVLVALSQGVMGFHRPAMEALTQKLVAPEDYATIGSLGAFRYSVGAIAGPALGGVIIAAFGVKAAYFFDFLSFAAAVVALSLMKYSHVLEEKKTSPLSDMVEGFRYALSKPELIGTYLVDIVAMVFAFPVALFPAMAENFGGAKAAGILTSAMAVGSLFMTLLSGWTSKVIYLGRAVIVAASLWAIFMIGVGPTNNLWVAFLFLSLAGAADMMSGLFRGIIWNRTIPNDFRGRLSGIEMISYMSGPLLGNFRAGWMASKYSVPVSVSGGAIVCLIGVLVTAFFLPKFRRFKID